jgi:DNA-binding HxlR family transcriptional regulator
MEAWESVLQELPITRAAFGPGGQRDRPRPIEQEWLDLAKDDGDMIAYVAGAWRRSGSAMAWGLCAAYLGGENHDGGHTHPALRATAASVERLLTPLAHQARVQIMQAMLDGPKTPSQLSAATRLTGGNLYQHLEQLLDATYVAKQGAAYDLTRLGCQILVTIALFADLVVRERQED